MTTNERRLGEEILGRLSGCPTADELQSYRDGSLERPEPVGRHVAACEGCRAALEFLDDDARVAGDIGTLPHEVEARTETLIESMTRPARGAGWLSSGPTWRWALGLGAAAALIIVAFQLPRGGDSTSPATFRQSEEGRIVSLLNEQESLRRENAVLRWSAGPQGTLYDVTVLDASLRVLDKTARLDANEYRIPPDKISGLKKDATLFWQVEALLQDGSRITSVTFVARLE